MRKKRVVVIICLLLVVALAFVVAWQFLHVDNPAVGDDVQDDNQQDVVVPVPVPIPETPHEHDWGDWIEATSATCVDMGQERRVCECGETQYRSIVALGHSFSDWGLLLQPTCVYVGYEQHDCFVCGQPEMRKIPALGHDYVDGICSRCGEVDPDYDFSCKHENTQGLISESTCTEDGSVKVSCADCGDLIRTEITPALGHNYVNGTCTRCGALDPNYIDYDISLFASVSEPVYLLCMSLDATNVGNVLFKSYSEDTYTLSLICSNDFGQTLTLGSLYAHSADACCFGVDHLFADELTKGIEYHFQVIFTAYHNPSITYISNYVDIVWDNSFYCFTASM